MILRDQARNPERAVSLHLARSGSQSERAIWFILPAHGASHIINKVIEKAKPLSYTRARESIVSLLRKFVPTTDIIRLHSFRDGEATSAANAQVPDRCWKRHGRWQSETAKDGYVEDSLDNRLLVSQSLGI